MGNSIDGFDWKRRGDESWSGVWREEKMHVDTIKYMPDTINIEGHTETRKFTKTNYNDGDGYLIYVDETNKIFAAYEIDK